MKVFDLTSLFRIFIEADSYSNLEPVKRGVLNILKERHNNEIDVTLITQDSVLASFNKIFTALTLALAGIAGISLTVAGIGIMNVMLVSVSERTPEIGLLKAIGVKPRQVVLVFLTEASLLSLFGGITGLVSAQFLVRLSLQVISRASCCSSQLGSHHCSRSSFRCWNYIWSLASETCCKIGSDSSISQKIKMDFTDVATLTINTIRAHRLRTILTMLGIAIGTASVILLTSIGEGLRTFMLSQFTQFGTNLMGIHPGQINNLRSAWSCIKHAAIDD